MCFAGSLRQGNTRKSLRIEALARQEEEQDSDVEVQVNGSGSQYTDYTRYYNDNCGSGTKRNRNNNNDNSNNNDNTNEDIPPKKRMKLQAEKSKKMKLTSNVQSRPKKPKVPPEYDGKFTKDRMSMQHRGGCLLQYSLIRLNKDVRKLRILTNLTITDVNGKHYLIEKNRLQTLEGNEITDNFKTNIATKSKLPGSMTWTADCESKLPDILRPTRKTKNSALVYYGTALQAAVNEYLVSIQKHSSEATQYCNGLARTGLPNERTYNKLVREQQPAASTAGVQKAAKVWHDFDIQLLSLWYLNKPQPVSIESNYKLTINARLRDTVTRHCGGYIWDTCANDYDGLKMLQFVGLHKFSEVYVYGLLLG